MLLRRIVLSAVLIGALAGVLLSALQFWQVRPIIHGAERFEHAHAPVAVAPAREATQTPEHAGRVHAAEDWKPPSEGVKRIGLTVLSNVLTAIGFALVMLATMAAVLKSNPAVRFDWRTGLLWGAAGYAIFFVAPAVGLPPEVPGAEAAPLEARQLWWLLAAGCTAAGLAIAAFGNSPWRWAALALLVVPHLVGAPHPGARPFADYPPEAAIALSELARRFVWATAFANAVFWLALGSAAAWVEGRFLKAAVA